MNAAFASRTPDRPSTHGEPRLTFHLPSIDSTNDQARRLARQHAGRVVLVSADEQIAGRGRAGRAWASPRGGAWFSLAVPLSDVSADLAAAPLAVGLGVITALRQMLSATFDADRLRLKWPNDVLLDGRKVAGMLCERVIGDGSTPQAAPLLIVGVGINVNLPEAALPRDVRFSATTLLAATGVTLPLVTLIQCGADAILRELVALSADGLSSRQHDALRGRLAWRGLTVEVERPPGEVVRGRCVDVDPRGRLRIETVQGAAWCEIGDARLHGPVSESS